MIDITSSIVIFFVSLALMVWSGSWLVGALTRVARYLGWREFVVAFFIIAVAGALSNFAVGISSALRGIPELSLGDVMGGNLIHFSFTIALVMLFSRTALSVEGVTVQASIVWALAVAVLPLLLLVDGSLSRADGVVLLFAFAAYVAWLFSKEERFKRIYDGTETKEEPVTKGFKNFMTDMGKVGLGLVVLATSAQGIVESTASVTRFFGLPIFFIGLLIIGLGNTLPETYFAAVAARRGRAEMIIGDIMGSVMVQASLVLGLVAILRPIHFPDFSPLAITRVFLILVAILFFVLSRTGRKITKSEAFILLAIYILFVLIEVLGK